MAYRYIYGTKDSSVNSGSSSTNYGGELSFNLGRASSYYRSLIYFDLSDLIALGSLSINTIELVLYQLDSGTDRADMNFSAHCINQDWSENAVTWSNQPTTTDTAAVTNLVQVEDNAGWRIHDITSLVKDIISNSRTYYGIMLKQVGTTDNTVKSYGTREWTAQATQLRYTLNGTVGYGADGVYNDCEVYYGTGGVWQLCKPYYGSGGVYNEIST